MCKIPVLLEGPVLLLELLEVVSGVLHLGLDRDGAAASPASSAECLDLYLVGVGVRPRALAELSFDL